MGRPVGSGRKPLKDRFWLQVIKTNKDECWIWIGSLDNNGYGRIGSGGSSALGAKNLHAHRVSFELNNGVIPEGFDVDHVCHTKECGKTGKIVYTVDVLILFI